MPTDSFAIVPTDKVEIVRHTYDCYEVTAYDVFGRVVGHRMFSYGRRRREWAIQQAESWADRFMLWHDEKIYC
jgi:hypothetical protein